MGIRVIVVQPAFPAYRRPLFDRMTTRFGDALVVYTSKQSELGTLPRFDSIPPTGPRMASRCSRSISEER